MEKPISLTASERPNGIFDCEAIKITFFVTNKGSEAI